MISTTKASGGVHGDVRTFQNQEEREKERKKERKEAILVVSFQLLVSLHKPISKFTTSSKPSKKSPCWHGKNTNKVNKNKNIHYNNQEKKTTKQMDDLKKFTTTVIQLHLSSHKNRSVPERKEKLQRSSLVKEHSQAQQNLHWISIYKRMMHVRFIW